MVGELHRIEALLDSVKALAVRHLDYGVEERHYATVGAALLWTPEEGLGAGFTPEVKDAWAAAYGLLSGAMIAAAEESRLAAIA